MTMSKDQKIEAARLQLEESLPLAVSTLRELMTLAEKESVRLAAAESLMERVGLTKKQELRITVDQAEHDRATQEAKELVEAMQRNKQALPAPQISLEAIVVHEGDDGDLPLAAPDTYGTVIEAVSREDTAST
jgi:hypothetical protein